MIETAMLVAVSFLLKIEIQIHQMNFKRSLRKDDK